jgi:hypothetical protein
MASLTLFWIISILLFFALLKRRYYVAQSNNKQENLAQWLSQLNTLYEVWLPMAAGLLVILPRSPLMASAFAGVSFLIFPRARLIFSELKIMAIQTYFLAYNLFYFFSDLYFIRIKPVFDLGMVLRRRSKEARLKAGSEQGLPKLHVDKQDFSPTTTTL